MRTYSIVFLDIDGTLLDSRHQVMPQTKQILKRLERRGVPIVLYAARPPREMAEVARRTGLHSPVMCYSGGLILSPDNSILRDVGIDAQLALQLKRFLAEYHSDVAVSANLYDVWLVDDLEHTGVRQEASTSLYTPVKGPLELAVRSVPHVHKLMCMGDPKRLLALKRDVARQFPQLVFFRSGTACLEILAPESSGRMAMEVLQDHYGLSQDETVVLGDGFLEMDMLRYAGLGIAMGNAPDQVKEAANRVTASNDEEGVYIALKNLKFKAPLSNTP